MPLPLEVSIERLIGDPSRLQEQRPPQSKRKL